MLGIGFDLHGEWERLRFKQFNAFEVFEIYNAIEGFICWVS
jgi:hypothetical protein